MNKSKIIMYTTIGLMSLILAYVMFIQFRTVNETDTKDIELMRETELKETLADYKERYSEVQEQIVEIQKQNDEYKQSERAEEETIALLEKDKKDLNMKLGLTDVEGDGIIIKMEDTKEATIMYSDLLQLVNELLLAGAEAISINDNRIVAMTDIVSTR